MQDKNSTVLHELCALSTCNDPKQNVVLVQQVVERDEWMAYRSLANAIFYKITGINLGHGKAGGVEILRSKTTSSTMSPASMCQHILAFWISIYMQIYSNFVPQNSSMSFNNIESPLADLLHLSIVTEDCDLSKSVLQKIEKGYAIPAFALLCKFVSRWYVWNSPNFYVGVPLVFKGFETYLGLMAPNLDPGSPLNKLTETMKPFKFERVAIPWARQMGFELKLLRPTETASLVRMHTKDGFGDVVHVPLCPDSAIAILTDSQSGRSRTPSCSCYVSSMLEALTHDSAVHINDLRSAIFVAQCSRCDKAWVPAYSVYCTRTASEIDLMLVEIFATHLGLRMHRSRTYGDQLRRTRAKILHAAIRKLRPYEQRNRLDSLIDIVLDHGLDVEQLSPDHVYGYTVKLLNTLRPRQRKGSGTLHVKQKDSVLTFDSSAIADVGPELGRHLERGKLFSVPHVAVTFTVPLSCIVNCVLMYHFQFIRDAFLSSKLGLLDWFLTRIEQDNRMMNKIPMLKMKSSCVGYKEPCINTELLNRHHDEDVDFVPKTFQEYTRLIEVSTIMRQTFLIQIESAMGSVLCVSKRPCDVRDNVARVTQPFAINVIKDKESPNARLFPLYAQPAELAFNKNVNIVCPTQKVSLKIHVRNTDPDSSDKVKQDLAALLNTYKTFSQFMNGSQ